MDIAAMYDIEVHIKNYSTVSGYGREVETAMYYIVHEAVFNAAKHSDCRNISISFETKEHFISASVCDDGIGIKRQNTEGGGLGIGLMIQRAEALGGSVEVSNDNGSGAEVFCKLPHGDGAQMPPNPAMQRVLEGAKADSDRAHSKS